jgi:hypothetical protein
MRLPTSPLLLAGAFLSSNVLADRLEQRVSVPMTGAYDSNPQMVAGGEGAYIARLAPQYTLTHISDANEFALSLGAVIARSSNQTVFQDQNDPNASLGWKHLTPTSEFSLNALYRQESARQAEFIQSGLVVPDTTRTTKGVVAGWTSQLTERLNYTLGADYSTISYDDTIPSLTRLIDYDTYGGRFSLAYEITPRDEVYWLSNGSRYQPNVSGLVSGTDLASDSTAYGSMLGYKQRVSDAIDWDIRAGWLTITGPEDDSTWQGNLRVTYTGEQSRLGVDVGRFANPTGTAGGYLLSNQVRAAYSYDLSERTTVGFDGSWIKNEETRFYPDATTATVVGVSGSHELDQFWSLRLVAQRRYSDYDNFRSSATGNLISLSLIYTHPDF